MGSANSEDSRNLLDIDNPAEEFRIFLTSLRRNQLMISSKRDPSSPTVRWSAIQSVFEEAKSDVLFLLDCCAAAGAAPDGGQGVIETIAACGFETWAPGPGRHSFTNALISVLDDWMTRSSFSAAMLHSEVLAVVKHDKPERRKWKDSQKVEMRKTPIYILTSNDPKSMSIELCRRLTPKSETKKGLSSSASSSDLDNYGPNNLNKRHPEGDLVIPHVLVSIALEENQTLDIEAWLRWIRQFPGLGKYAMVEGVFKSHSTVMLLSLPVPIWNVLPDEMAVSFVAYVKSKNMLAYQSLEEYKRISEESQASKQSTTLVHSQLVPNLAPATLSVAVPDRSSSRADRNMGRKSEWGSTSDLSAIIDPRKSYVQRKKDLSCDACRERKVKCDATEITACSECSSLNVKCQFTKETNHRMSSIKQVQDLEKQLAYSKRENATLKDMLRDLRSYMERTEEPKVPAESSTLEKKIVELTRELRLCKDEATRAWDELAKREHEEHERVMALRDGLPAIVGGVMVVPSVGVSETSEGTRENPKTGPGFQSIKGPIRIVDSVFYPTNSPDPPVYGSSIPSEEQLNEHEYEIDEQGGFVRDAKGGKVQYHMSLPSVKSPMDIIRARVARDREMGPLSP